MGSASWTGTSWIGNQFTRTLDFQYIAGQSEAEDAIKNHDRGAIAPGRRRRPVVVFAASSASLWSAMCRNYAVPVNWLPVQLFAGISLLQ